jgi:CRISPR-associated protein Csb2
MADFLRISVRYLQPLAHGRASGGEPEWPPSPLRLFQAIVASAAAKYNERDQLESTLPALRWLESCPLESIVACNVEVSQAPAQFYVPDNSADLLVPAWKRGEANVTPKRTEKVVRPVHLDGDAVHFDYRLPHNDCPHFDVIRTCARSITHLGWGIDVVVADAKLVNVQDPDNLQGERWRIAQSGGVALRIHTSGTLDDLMRKHNDSLNRLTEEGFHPVPPLRRFEIRRFRRECDDEIRPFCVFQILKPDASGVRAFNASTRTRDVAAWIRHAVADVCQHWSDLSSFVHGHGPSGGSNQLPNSSHRFQYLPLPTINSALNRVESIRRVMVVAPLGFQDRIDFIRRRLLGHELNWQSEVVGVLNLLSGRDYVRDQYLGPSEIWSTVTPVILDGFDDHNAAKTEKLLRKALFNAGLVRRVDFEDIEMDWSPFGFRSGVDSAKQFIRPEKLNGTMLHVRLRFARPKNGPIAIGAGRYRGFGLMVRTD